MKIRQYTLHIPSYKCSIVKIPSLLDNFYGEGVNQSVLPELPDSFRLKCLPHIVYIHWEGRNLSFYVELHSLFRFAIFLQWINQGISQHYILYYGNTFSPLRLVKKAY